MIARRFLDDDDLSVIQAPAVFTLSQWVADRSARIDLLCGCPAARNADPMFMLRLWNAEIRKSLPGLSRLESQELASKAREADRMIRQWCLPRPVAGEGINHRQFEVWRKAVRKAMKAGHWFSNEDWHGHLLSQVGGNTVPDGLMPGTIHLSGFVEFTRLEEKLFDALKQRGIRIRRVAPRKRVASRPDRQRFESQEHEITAAAKWAHDRVGDGCRQVAVIVHDLAGMVNKVRRIFEDEFYAPQAGSTTSDSQAIFSISNGNSLAEEPMVRDAFMLLDLAIGGARRRHDFYRISRFLRSANYAGGGEERFARAQLEILLRRRGIFRLSLNTVAEQAVRSAHFDQLKILVRQINGMGQRDPESSPARQLLEILIAWGWPGDGLQDETTQSITTRVLRQIEALSRHSFDTADDCLEWLKRACESDRESGPGGALSPVQVISVEEAHGRNFDAARVLNFTLANWPARPYNNPFVNSEMLAGVPRASENGMLAYAQKITESLKACASEIAFSWCDRLDDQAVSCSPLIKDLPLLEHESGPVSALWSKLEPEAGEISGYRDHPWLKEIPGEQGVALVGQGPQDLRSAVKFINYQSASPLAAYLAFRLAAQMEPMPEPFEGGAYRGELVHAALEQLFRPYQGKNQGPARDNIADAVERALEFCSADLHLLPVELSAARKSLVELLENWLEFESQWQGGNIEATEWKGHLEFEGFLIDVRIDRINRLADGSHFLLDYKTGSSARLADWGEGRLRQVQLPLYAVLLDRSSDFSPSGISWAYVRPNEMKFAGLSGGSVPSGMGISAFAPRPLGLAKTLGSWDAALEGWSHKLAGLLSEIRSGECANLLFDDQTLTYADLRLLLRREEGLQWNKEVCRHASQ